MVKFSAKFHHRFTRAALCVLLLPTPAIAGDFTVANDTSVTNGGFAIIGGDMLTINSGVTLDHTGVGVLAAVDTIDGFNTVTNNGTIIGDGGMNGRGVVFNGSSSIFINNGLLRTTATTISGAHGMAGLIGVSAKREFSERLRGNTSAEANVGSNGLVNIKGSARLSFDF